MAWPVFAIAACFIFAAGAAAGASGICTGAADSSCIGGACSGFAAAEDFSFDRPALTRDAAAPCLVTDPRLSGLSDAALLVFAAATSPVLALGPGFNDLKQLTRSAAFSIARQCATSSKVAAVERMGLVAASMRAAITIAPVGLM